MRQTAVKAKLIAVHELMTRDVQSCRAEDTLNVAARLMWDHDCGCLPVVDENEKVIAMITDRDICMAAYTRGVPLAALRVAQAMSKQVHACRVDDSISVAEKIMREHQVRRLPVISADGVLVGILSLNDLAREAVREHVPARREVSPEGLAETFAAVCEPRASRAGAAPAA